MPRASRVPEPYLLAAESRPARVLSADDDLPADDAAESRLVKVLPADLPAAADADQLAADYDPAAIHAVEDGADINATHTDAHAAATHAGVANATAAHAIAENAARTPVAGANSHLSTCHAVEADAAGDATIIAAFLVSLCAADNGLVQLNEAHHSAAIARKPSAWQALPACTTAPSNSGEQGAMSPTASPHLQQEDRDSKCQPNGPTAVDRTFPRSPTQPYMLWHNESPTTVKAPGEAHSQLPDGADSAATINRRVAGVPLQQPGPSALDYMENSTFAEPLCASAPSLPAAEVADEVDIDGDNTIIQDFIGHLATEDAALVQSTQAQPLAGIAHQACNLIADTNKDPSAAPNPAANHDRPLQLGLPTVKPTSSQGFPFVAICSRHTDPHVHDPHLLDQALAKGRVLSSTLPLHQRFPIFGQYVAMGYICPLSMSSLLNKLQQPAAARVPSLASFVEDAFAAAQSIIQYGCTLSQVDVFAAYNDEEGTAKVTHSLTKSMKGTQSFNASSHASSNPFPVQYAAVSSTYIPPPTSTFNKKPKLVQATNLLSTWILITFDPGGQADHPSRLYNQLYNEYDLPSTSTHTPHIGFVLSLRLRRRMCGVQAHEIIHATDLSKHFTHAVIVTKSFKPRLKQRSELLIFFMGKSTIDPG